MVWPFCVVKVAFHVPARLWSAANSGEFSEANANVNAAKEAEVRKGVRNVMRINFFRILVVGGQRSRGLPSS